MMTGQTRMSFARRKTHLEQSFDGFHERNPEVFNRMVAIALRLKAKGWVCYSVRAIMYHLRVQADLSTTGSFAPAGGREQLRCKLNNNHSPYYARLIEAEHPELAGFFVKRTVKGDDDG